MSVVLITGCSSGIGMETALAFARRGDTVYATMRTPAKADRLRIYVKSGENGGDPRVVADAIVGISDDPDAPHHLVGDDAVMFVDLVQQSGTFEGWTPVATQIVESVSGPRPVRPKPD